MKTLVNKIARYRKLTLLVCIAALLLKPDISRAQMPDCISGTVMYGVFSPVVPASPAFPTPGKDSTEIRSINFATGAVGPLMGGRRYYIRRNPGGGTSASSYFYGASAMALDGLTGKFYIMTQMGGGGTTTGDKDVVMIDPLAPTAFGTTIATIATISPGGTSGNMDSYHFVKMAMAPNGHMYALGVNRSSAGAASTFNPLIRITPCAVPTAGCATASARLLGYIQSGGVMDRMNLYNGDIAFDATGNLYFFASAFQQVGSTNRYTDSRLFRINAANIPSAAGTGVIPMTFLADFNSMDSTGASGLALDPAGNMYMSVRRYTDNNPSSSYTTELYRSYDTATADLVPTFGTVPDSTSVGDLAACFFPSALLSDNNLLLAANHDAGKSILKWEVDNNNAVNYFEVQRSDNGINFETIAMVYPDPASPLSSKYQYSDVVNNIGQNKYYRIRHVMKNGIRYYSNIAQVYLNGKINLVGSISPNPFVDHFNFTVQLKTARPVGIRVSDQSGRIVYRNQYTATAGENKFIVNDVNTIRKGIYFVEIFVDNQIIRQKLIKQ
jgi:hypothetical protein